MEQHEDGTLSRDDLTFEEILELLDECLEESGVKELNFNDE